MTWVWRQKKWPNFFYDTSKLSEYETQFLILSGELKGRTEYIYSDEKLSLEIDIMSQEAISTAQIEGELLQRESVRESIRRYLGLSYLKRKSTASELGMAEMIVHQRATFKESLSHHQMHKWHKMIFNGRRDIESIGTYRQHEDPMQIVSGSFNYPIVNYEAPPSKSVPKEMNDFVNWFNHHATHSELPTIVFAGIAYVYFEMIHPYEDGNGRIGRVLVEKAMAMRLNAPTLNSLTKVIEIHKKKYYSELQKCNTDMDITDWLEFFCEIILESQRYSMRLIDFIVQKTKFFNFYQSKLNSRQEKVIKRMFEEGIEGFQGGLSAENYKTIASTSSATTTRDLHELVEIGAMKKQGQLKHTRYELNINREFESLN